MASRRVKPIPPTKPKKLAGRKITRFSDLPIEVLTENLLPQMGLQEARRYLLADAQILPYVKSSDQCKYLTEERALCQKKKVFNIPPVGEIDCVDYCGCLFTPLFEFLETNPKELIGILYAKGEAFPFEATGTFLRLYHHDVSTVELWRREFTLSTIHGFQRIDIEKATDWCDTLTDKVDLSLFFESPKLPEIVSDTANLVLFTPDMKPFFRVDLTKVSLKPFLTNPNRNLFTYGLQGEVDL